MNLHEGVILGIVQGLTEFLPVSSSGHLVLGQLFFGYEHSQLIFDISVHMGTLLAVVLVYFRDLAAMASAFIRFLPTLFRGGPVREQIRSDRDLAMGLVILLGSIPTAMIGLALKKIEHILFSSSLVVSLALLVTGTVLWLSRHYYHTDADRNSRVSAGKALAVGLVQGLAVIPGISRSGSTIAAGMFLGLDRATAARFSFLLSVPAVAGAELIGIKDMLETGAHLDMVTFWATLAAFISGTAALKVLIRLVHAGRFHLFAPYCWTLGALVLLSNFIL